MIIGVPLKDWFMFALALSTAIFVAWNRVADNKARQVEANRVRAKEITSGLAPNPARCVKHSEDIAVLKKDIEHIVSDMKEIRDDVRYIKENK
jgi:hypothetical protein